MFPRMASWEASGGAISILLDKIWFSIGGGIPKKEATNKKRNVDKKSIFCIKTVVGKVPKNSESDWLDAFASSKKFCRGRSALCKGKKK